MKTLPGLPSFEDRETVRNSKHFKDFIYQWNHGVYNRQNLVGPLMASIKNYFTSTTTPTREGWIDYYLTNVRTLEQVNNLINSMAEGTGLDFETAATYWSIHILDGAYTGMEGEQYAYEAFKQDLLLKQKPYTVRYATGEEDSSYGVDLVVEDQNKEVIIGLQVKRASYFHSHRSTVTAARAYNQKKYEKFKTLTGADVWYVNIDALYKTEGKIDTTVWRKANNQKAGY